MGITIHNNYGQVIETNFGTVNNMANTLQDERQEKVEVPHFPLNKTKDEGVALYNFLTENHYMTARLDSWLFLMGFVTEKPEKVVPITWLTTKEQFRMMLRFSFENLIENKSMKVVDIEELAPACFVDVNGEPMNVPKARTEYSNNTDRLTKFFRPSSD